MSSSRYIECEIRVESYDKVVFHNRDRDAIDEGSLYLAPICRKIARFENLLRVKELDKRQEFREFGELLYQCLFNGDLGNVLRDIIKEIQESKRYRLQLNFCKEVEDLAGIPWEFLHCPDIGNLKGFFLVDHPYLVISRYIPSGLGRANLDTRENSLKVLVVTSQPKDSSLSEVSSDGTIEEIKNLTNIYSVIVEELPDPNIEEIQNKITQFKPHIFHYIGHGKFDFKRKVGKIALVKSDKTPDWVNDETFGDFFRYFQPRLVILQACQSGEVDFTANYAGLAPQLIRNRIPAVIAMQYPISNGVASLFSKAFYKALANHESVEVAMQQGRGEIARYNPFNSDSNFYTNRDFGTPVLYMSARNSNDYIIPKTKRTKKFNAEDLMNSSSELEEAINTFNSDDLNFLLYNYDEKLYQELSKYTQDKKVKTLISKLQGEKNTKDLIDHMKYFKPEYFI